VSRIGHLARTYWFDLLIALLAIVAILDVVLGRGSSGAPTTTLWFCPYSRGDGFRLPDRRRTGFWPRESRSSTRC
jgi:hypothetical protein